MKHVALGRPRDPGVEQRVIEAALDLYGRLGWSGFSIDAVARQARVGKASIYRRWSSSAELCADALATIIPDITAVDCGSLRSDLIEFGTSTLELHFGPHADAFLRLNAEAHHIPELATRWEAMRGKQITATRTIVRRAVRSGELPEGTPVTVLLEAIFGGILIHALAAPPHLRDRAHADGSAHVAQLVDLALAGVAASRSAGQRS